MGTQKVVLDTNVLVSAFGWRGPSRRILEEVLDGRLELIISERQLREIERVLAYPRLGFTENQQKRFMAILVETSTLVKTSGRLAVIREDPSDDVLLETAAEHRAAWLVSGDQHLLKIREFQDIRIVKPAEFAARFGLK